MSVLTDGYWWQAFAVTTSITVVSVVIEFVLGLTIALVMHRTIVGKGLVRTVVLIPYGIVTVALDGKTVATDFDGYNFPAVVLSDELDWGTHELTTGDHQLTFTLAPPNPAAAPGNMVGLDYVRLEKK